MYQYHNSMVFDDRPWLLLETPLVFETRFVLEQMQSDSWLVLESWLVYEIQLVLQKIRYTSERFSM